jgi:hypothetical protein
MTYGDLNGGNGPGEFNGGTPEADPWHGVVPSGADGS